MHTGKLVKPYIVSMQVNGRFDKWWLVEGSGVWDWGLQSSIPRSHPEPWHWIPKLDFYPNQKRHPDPATSFRPPSPVPTLNTPSPDEWWTKCSPLATGPTARWADSHFRHLGSFMPGQAGRSPSPWHVSLCNIAVTTGGSPQEAAHNKVHLFSLM